MTVTATRPHPIYLAGKWVESPELLEISNPADGSTPAGATYAATEAYDEEAVTTAAAAFRETRVLTAYERGSALREISAGIRHSRAAMSRIRRAPVSRRPRRARVVTIGSIVRLMKY